MCWKLGGMFFSIEFGILSSPRVLLFSRFFRHKLYVSMFKYVCSGVCGFPLFSSIKPSRSCHKYCLSHTCNCGGDLAKSSMLVP